MRGGVSRGDEAPDVSDWGGVGSGRISLSCSGVLPSFSTLSSSLELSEGWRSLDGDVVITEVLFEGIGSDGFGLFCIAAKACCTASCLTSE